MLNVSLHTCWEINDAHCSMPTYQQHLPTYTYTKYLKHLFPWRFPQLGALSAEYGMDWINLLDSLIQSIPDGFELDWIRNSPTQRILDWT